MRVCLVGLHFAEYTTRLALALAENHDVLLILSEPNFAGELDGVLPEKPPRLTLATLPHRISPKVILGNTFELVGRIKAFKPDVIHLQEVTRDYQVFALPFLKRIAPIVGTVHDPSPHSGLEAKRHARSRHRFYEPWSRSFYDRAIVHGESLALDLKAAVPKMDLERIFVIPHGPLGPMTVPKVKPENGNLLFFGRIHAYKGLRYFIEAVKDLKARGYKVKGVIAGEGSDLPPYRDEILNESAFELIEGYIPRSRSFELFEQAQLAVLPYTDGTQSGVAALSFGFGRPVVATRVGSLPELISDGVTGVLVEPRNAKALADAIARLLENSAAYDALVQGVTDNISGPFSWKSIADMTVRVYEGTCSESVRLVSQYE
ncbi:MAG: glycosyltransferase family 4 protein [Azonexus sp.]